MMAQANKVFKRIFALRNIKEAYNKDISKKATRGIDKVGIKNFNKNKDLNCKIIFRKCNNGNYQFSPYVEKLLNKGRNKNPRILSLPTIRDRIVLHLLNQLLQEVFPESLNHKLPNNYIRDISEFCKNNVMTDVYIYKVDIKSFYDQINRNLLMKVLKKRIRSNKILRLIYHAINNVTVPNNYRRKDKLKFKMQKGVPQGITISNILANIYLTEFDNRMGKLGLKYLRYVDDILIFCKKDEQQQIKFILDSELTKLELVLNYDKTISGQFNTEFQYLGYNLSLPKISVKDLNIERFITSIAAMFTSYLHKSEIRMYKYPWLTKDLQKKVFLFDLNEKISGAIADEKRYGWIFYFLQINDMGLLHKLDSIIVKFFKRLEDYNFVPPKGLKSLSKAYYKAKYDPYGGYIHDFNKYQTLKSKIVYLSDRGYLNPASQSLYNSDQIELLFDRVKRKRLLNLELDIGKIS